MGKVIILPETTKNPITLIGERAGYCWGGDVSNPEKNYKRGLDCIKSNHGRTFEFVNIETVITGYSARVIREWYTHIGGSPTRLQESTRYVDGTNFDYVIPPSITSNEALEYYHNAMMAIKEAVTNLKSCGVPKEDYAMLLPLGMKTTIVDKRNLRNIVDMSRQRECNRAYWEYRNLFADYKKELSKYSDEWKTLTDLLFMPKCEVFGYCPEKNSCGRKPKRKE